eukprot:9938428-Prorocentrum_lima.AAC.1
MTSSLVGSEMCIRDRRKVVPEFLCSTCSTYYDVEAGREPDAAYIKGKGTVSYTHLTLPTICSV